MREALAALILLVLASAVLPGTTAQETEKLLVPGDTKVAILPFINATGSDNTEESETAPNLAYQVTHDQLFLRGFQLIPLADVKRAIAEEKIDFTDPEERVKANYLKIAERVNATVVVAGALTSYRSEMSGGSQAGVAKMELKVLLVAESKYLVTGTFEGKQKYRAFSFSKSRDLRLKAVDLAVMQGLEKLIKPYAVDPERKKALEKEQEKER